MADLYIFDFDGTLTNNGHRRYLEGDPTKYFEERIHDTPNDDVLAVLDTIPTDADIVLVTNRSPIMRGETLQFLEQYFFPKLYSHKRISVSFRTSTYPEPDEKVRRIIDTCNRLVCISQSVCVPPTSIEMYEDDQDVIDLLRRSYSKGKFLAKQITLWQIPYDESGKRLPLEQVKLEQRKRVL